MNFRTNENGTVLFYEYYYLEDGSRKQISVTMQSYTKTNERRAKSYLVRKIVEQGGSLKPLKKIKKQRKLPETYVPPKYLFKKIWKDWERERMYELKPSTFVVEQHTIKNSFSLFEKRDIRKITTAELQEFFLEKMDLSYATVKKLKEKFTIFFRYAIRMGYITDNPVTNVYIPKKPLKEEDYRKRENKYLTLEEMKTLIAFVNERRKSYTRMSLAFIYLTEFLFYTGLRIGEAIALRWEDIDLEKKELTVRHTFDYYSNNNYTPILQTPKTRASIRTISLNKRSREIIELCKKLTFQRKGREKLPKELKQFIFRNRYGGLIQLPNFNRFLQEQGKICFPEKEHFKLSSHCLRHSHITLLVERGLPLKAIMQRVGHVNETTTLKIYTHVTEQMKNVIAEAIEDL